MYTDMCRSRDQWLPQCVDNIKCVDLVYLVIKETCFRIIGAYSFVNKKIKYTWPLFIKSTDYPSTLDIFRTDHFREDVVMPLTERRSTAATCVQVPKGLRRSDKCKNLNQPLVLPENMTVTPSVLWLWASMILLFYYIYIIKYTHT